MANEGICDRYCKSCVFNGYGNERMTVCEYFLQTGLRRPCPAGTGCTVKSTGEKKSLWQHQSDQSWNQKQKREAKAKEVLHKVCPCCGTDFDTTDPRKIFCSIQCKNREKQRELHRRNKTVLTITCAICGKQFTSTDGRRKCCSPECTHQSRLLTYKRYYKKRGKRNGKEK